MRNNSDTCAECGRRVPPGAAVVIVHEWQATRIEGWSPKTYRQQWPCTHRRRDRWVCFDCALSNHSFENSIAESGHCENCGRETRHWDFSQPMPSACCADCRRLAANKRSRQRRRVEHQLMVCAVCGEAFTPA